MARGELEFAHGGQELARAFSRAHVTASRDGAFFVLELGASTAGTMLYGLIKYDYRNALELTDRDGRHRLREIVQAFVTDRRAVQKFCLVRVVDGRAQDEVLAFDRMGKAPDLTDYFGQFLVRRDRSDAQLSADLNDMLRATLSACKGRLPGQDVVAAMEASKESLRGRERVDEGAMREALLAGCGNPQDEVIRRELDGVATREIRRRRLTGMSFVPSPEVLARKPRRQIRTVERVSVAFPGQEEGRSVSLRRRDDGPGWVITVVTREELVENAAVADRAG